MYEAEVAGLKLVFRKNWTRGVTVTQFGTGVWVANVFRMEGRFEPCVRHNYAFCDRFGRGQLDPVGRAAREEICEHARHVYHHQY